VSDVGDFSAAEHLAVGAFGQPGQRVFVLQVNQEGRTLTMKVEKGQVAELAAHLARAMADRPPVEPTHSPDAATLTEAAEPAWVVGAIRLGYDSAADRIGLVLEEFRRPAEDADDPGEEPFDVLGDTGEDAAADVASARITMTAEQATALIAAIENLVAGSRPPCPHCGYPLDPSGHVCPKSNGHTAPKL
jgi:uncharacterized repeat protein (TIGR03847 family)